MRDQIQPTERPLTAEEREWDYLTAPRAVTCLGVDGRSCDAEPVDGCDHCATCLQALESSQDALVAQYNHTARRLAA